MQNLNTTDIDGWVEQLSGIAIPVLPQSIARLRELKANSDNINPRNLSHAILHDPMLTITVLRTLRSHRTDRMQADITTVEHAIMMLGVNPFFRMFSDLQSIDRLLGKDQAAFNGLMAVVGRARHAALLARQWAQLRNDVESDEVIIAALLHDMAEMLLWCFAPRLAEQIESRLNADRERRSSDVQFEVLGFRLNELELALVKAWELPTLLTSLLDDYQADRPRARNVMLAINLARHAAHGWGDAAIPDDLLGVQRLIGGSLHSVRQSVYSTSLHFVRDHSWYGDDAPPVWLPPFPFPVDPGAVAPVASPIEPLLLDQIRRLLESSLDDALWMSTKMLQAGPEGIIQLPGLITLLMQGLYKGAGFTRCAYFRADRTGQLRAQYLRGLPTSALLGATTLPDFDFWSEPAVEAANGSALWFGKNPDDAAVETLPLTWKKVVSGTGFALARITLSTGAKGLVYADTQGAKPLRESQFIVFQELCRMLQTRLDGSLSG